MYKKLLYDFEEIDKNNAETYDIDKSIVENNKWILEDKIGYDINIGKCFNGDGEEVQLYWVSFDSASYNFHIVPDKERDNMDKMDKIRENLKVKVKELKWKIVPKRRKPRHTSQHKWIEVVADNDSFLLNFQTLSFDKKNRLNCYLDKIQFYKFPKAVKGPNYISNNELVTLYPDCSDSEKKEGVNPDYPEHKVVVKNTNLNLKTSSEEKIVEEFIEKNTNYNEVRKQYIEERKKERKKIIKYVFEDMGYKVKKFANAGHGSEKYTSGGQMKEFDLSYWMWVDAEKEGKKYSIYLQSFDRDPNGNQNYHVLLDRLFVQVDDGEIKRTDIDLPLDDEKINQLKEIIKQL